MALRIGFEVLGRQRGAGRVDAPGVGHVRHHVHGGAAQPVRRGQHGIGIVRTGDAASGRKAAHQRVHAGDRVGTVLDRAMAR
ncbi:hypothetical protein D9M70_543100 [compost metagenome]